MHVKRLIISILYSCSTITILDNTYTSKINVCGNITNWCHVGDMCVHKTVNICLSRCSRCRPNQVIELVQMLPTAPARADPFIISTWSRPLFSHPPLSFKFPDPNRGKVKQRRHKLAFKCSLLSLEHMCLMRIWTNKRQISPIFLMQGYKREVGVTEGRWCGNRGLE